MSEVAFVLNYSNYQVEVIPDYNGTLSEDQSLILGIDKDEPTDVNVGRSLFIQKLYETAVAEEIDHEFFAWFEPYWMSLNDQERAEVLSLAKSMFFIATHMLIRMKASDAENTFWSDNEILILHMSRLALIVLSNKINLEGSSLMRAVNALHQSRKIEAAGNVYQPESNTNVYFVKIKGVPRIDWTFPAPSNDATKGKVTSTVLDLISQLELFNDSVEPLPVLAALYEAASIAIKPLWDKVACNSALSDFAFLRSLYAS